MQYLGYFLLGAVAGLLGGGFGIGGGIVMVPAILILFKQPIHVAIGTSMMVIVPLSIAGALRHWSLHNVAFQIVLFAGLGGIIGAVLGASIIEKVPPIYVKRVLAVLLVYSAFRLWFSK
ncbi:MAG: sulfite exporter TauE/SafE family protein [bacterium]|jgi:hypothetical protein|nr:sulfite exporter TauE/SafE family protein [bacterium]